MSASDHIGMQFKVTPVQQDALDTWLVDRDSDEKGFTQNYESKAISVHNLGRASLSVNHAGHLMDFSNEEYKVRGAAKTAKGLNNLSWRIRDQYDISQAAAAMIGGKMTPIERA